MVLRIQFRNNGYDYINAQRLDDLINKKAILQFYRPLAKRWVKIDIDPIRGKASGPYVGVERRE
jgi:hypothetical protein